MDDAQIDALFRRAAASTPGGSSARGEDDAAGWDERADAILERARAERASAAPADLDALLAAPPLAPEPGENDGSPASGGTSRAAPTSVPGVHDRNSRMSDEISKPPPSRRPSLKELAESVKNRPSSPGGPSSQRPPPSLKNTLVALDGKTPPPPAAGDSVPPSRPAVVTSPLRGGAAATPSSTNSAPPSGPVSSPTPSTPSPTSAPSSAPMAVAAPSGKPAAAPATQPSAARPGAAKSSSGTGKVVGVACFLAAAAAAAFALTRPAAPTATPAPMVAEAAPAAPTAEAVAEPAAPAPAETAQPEGVIDINQLADADAAASAAPVVGGPLPTGPAPSASAAAVAKNDPAKPAGPGEELGDAIRNRAGGGSDAPEDAEPAAGEPSKKNLPDVPPTGAVTSAVNAVKGNAKGCVAGADEPSSATITFSSSGAVQSVTVGGWAQGKSAAGCIKSALQGARVPAFARPTYATSVTIRP